MIVTLFRSHLSADAGADYRAMDDAMLERARATPGFVAIKSYVADDGEHLSVVWWKDAETLELWRNDPRHLDAKRLGRERWYQDFRIEVAEVLWSSEFARDTPANKNGPGDAVNTARPKAQATQEQGP